MIDEDFRQLRLDLAAARDGLRPNPQSHQPRWMIGRVTGSPVTSVPAYFKVIPQHVGGLENEGVAGSLRVADGTATVLVIGPVAPVLNTALQAFMIDGRWVAETCGPPAVKSACGCHCKACGGKSLLDGHVADANGTAAMAACGSQSDPLKWTPAQQSQFVTADSCSCDTAQELRYSYSYKCLDDGDIQLTVNAVPTPSPYGHFVNWRLGGPSFGPCPDCDNGYVWSSDTTPTPRSGVFTSTATPTCDAATLTATFAFDPVSGINPPSASATLTMPIERTGTGPCYCQPWKCLVCGTVRAFMDDAIYTDDNGSGPMGTAFNGEYPLYVGVGGLISYSHPLTKSLPTIDVAAGFGGAPCEIVNRDMVYGWGIDCGKITLYVPCLMVCCPHPPCAAEDYRVAYSWYSGSGIGYQCYQPKVLETTIDCHDTYYTLSATVPDIDVLAPPSRNISIRIPIERPEHRLCCKPCGIPEKDLTLSWLNPIAGPGSTTLAYADDAWTTGCVNELKFSLGCDGTPPPLGNTRFAATYFLSGVCPTGESQQCISTNTDPTRLTLVDSTCDPFHLHYQVTGTNCPVLSASGYTDFFVDEI